ncbi:metallophosphoesterase [Paraburkholderia oxyphila]|uniref:metallophosphoesterase n=1 Tax=Paraburkholderia oxyphila TaxID=614212 RepID=UPI000693F4D1|nr:metallophosphoesterase [Paraburkholderia oxyphila]
MFIVQLTDLHVVEPGTLGHNGTDNTQYVAHALSRVGALEPKPRAVVLTGDLADHGSVAEYAALRAMLDEIDVPAYLALGNHDNRANFLEVFGNAPCLAQRGAFVQYRVNLGDLDLLVLDTLQEGKIAGHFCDERLAWLADDLAAHRGRPTLVALHHPPIDGLSQLEFFEKGGDWYHALLDTLGTHDNIIGIMAGHTHRSASTTTQGIPLLVGPAACGYQAHMSLDWTRLDVTLAFEAPTMYLHRYADARITSHLIPASDAFSTLRPPYAEHLEKLVESMQAPELNLSQGVLK